MKEARNSIRELKSDFTYLDIINFSPSSYNEIPTFSVYTGYIHMPISVIYLVNAIFYLSSAQL